MNSREKGKRGELEFAHFLIQRGFSARRGAQFRGGSDSPDVITDIPRVHFEVKRCEAGSLYDWLAQATRDCGAKMPIVAHRKNNREWVAILQMESLLWLLKEVWCEAANMD